MKKDWYESPDWDAAAQADFRIRLSRARNQKAYYLKMKIAAIADIHPQDALALCDERIASGDEEDAASASYAKCCIHARLGEIDNMFSSLRDAIGQDGVLMGAPAAGEFCCLVGYYGKSELFSFANHILARLDDMAMAEQGRPFRSFSARAAHALIRYRSGQRSAAIEPAKEALALAVDQQSYGGSLLKSCGPIPGFPNPLHDMLLVAAELWNETELGAPPLR